jgi:hypothetical protein
VQIMHAAMRVLRAKLHPTFYQRFSRNSPIFGPVFRIFLSGRCDPLPRQTREIRRGNDWQPRQTASVHRLPDAVITHLMPRRGNVSLGDAPFGGPTIASDSLLSCAQLDRGRNTTTGQILRLAQQSVALHTQCLATL